MLTVSCEMCVLHSPDTSGVCKYCMFASWLYICLLHIVWQVCFSFVEMLIDSFLVSVLSALRNI
jgi:hypothetical protein